MSRIVLRCPANRSQLPGVSAWGADVDGDLCMGIYTSQCIYVLLYVYMCKSIYRMGVSMVVYLLEWGHGHHLLPEVLNKIRPPSATEYPKTWRGVIWAPNRSTEPVINKMSLKTPASVRTNPLPAPTRNTAATLSKKATEALEIRINGPIRANS